MYYMDWYYSVKVVFAAYNVYRMIFKGAILDGARNIHYSPYLNSTTVPFDMCTYGCLYTVYLYKVCILLLHNFRVGVVTLKM